MEWKQEYLVGIHEIDAQHKALTECISSIEQAVAQYDRQTADAALVRLADLAQAHFTLEESLMRILDYPRLEEHADDHKQFSVHLNTLHERSLTTDVFHDRIEALQKWWISHVQKHDKSCALHFLKYAASGKS
jgi:hemerythrin